MQAKKYRRIMTLSLRKQPIPVRLRADLAQDGRLQETLARVAAMAHSPFVEATTPRGANVNNPS